MLMAMLPSPFHHRTQLPLEQAQASPPAFA
jgi:hypothetical protein